MTLNKISETTINNGEGEFNYTVPANHQAGTYEITAKLLENDQYEESSDTANLIIVKPLTINLQNIIRAVKQETITITANAVSGQETVNTGKIQFYLDENTLNEPIPVTSGVASTQLTIPDTLEGEHNIKAVFIDDDSYEQAEATSKLLIIEGLNINIPDVYVDTPTASSEFTPVTIAISGLEEYNPSDNPLQLQLTDTTGLIFDTNGSEETINDIVYTHLNNIDSILLDTVSILTPTGETITATQEGIGLSIVSDGNNYQLFLDTQAIYTLANNKFGNYTITFKTARNYTYSESTITFNLTIKKPVTVTANNIIINIDETATIPVTIVDENNAPVTRGNIAYEVGQPITTESQRVSVANGLTTLNITLPTGTEEGDVLTVNLEYISDYNTQYLDSSNITCTISVRIGTTTTITEDVTVTRGETATIPVTVTPNKESNVAGTIELYIDE